MNILFLTGVVETWNSSYVKHETTKKFPEPAAETIFARFMTSVKVIRLTNMIIFNRIY